MKHKTAVNVLMSWLRAAGISTFDNEGAICFHGPRGVNRVVVGSGDSQDTIYIDPDHIANRSSKKSVETFRSLMDMCGVTNYLPIVRGNEDDLDSRASMADGEIELRAMRHNEFRTAPEVSSDVMDSLSSCIKNVARIFYKKNTNLFTKMAIDVEDLEQYARVWTVNFMHKYRSEQEDDNRKLLTNYLKQRFVEFYELIKKSSASSVPTIETIETHAYSSAVPLYDDEHFEWAVYPVEYVEEEQPEEKSKAPSTLKDSARKRLMQAIESLPREEAIQRLTEAAENDFLAPDAQKLAKSLAKRYMAAS
jgi:hypothetical protein